MIPTDCFALRALTILNYDKTDDRCTSHIVGFHSGNRGCLRLYRGLILRTFLYQLFACQHLVCLKILLDGLIHDILWQCPVVIWIGLQPVTGKLLVKGWLTMTWFVSFCRPESGTVRCQHLITDHHIAILIQPEFKLGICNDDTLAQCIFCTLLI